MIDAHSESGGDQAIRGFWARVRTLAPRSSIRASRTKKEAGKKQWQRQYHQLPVVIHRRTSAKSEVWPRSYQNRCAQ
ncbi:unnamed protein product [Cuscuta campestris]|uniref:Uncharacterized protein n=1 Tax=Cuscuta campestris TaxID=132261 RepID=A0A484LEM4_9ASTE|nr:unnamed protein product [Cuscuta campestris]